MTRAALKPEAGAALALAFPMRIERRASTAAEISRLLLVMPAVLAIAIPLMLIIAHVFASPDALALMAERPIATVQVIAGMAIWIALFILPVSRVISRLGRDRVIVIEERRVRIEERSLFRGQTRSLALSDYIGVTHVVRASLSGLTDEIVLVHPDAGMNVTVFSGEAANQAGLDRMAAFLGLPVVPVQTLYDRGMRTAAPTLAESGMLTPARA